MNTANVDILWSTDNGSTWTILMTGTPNDGSENITIPDTLTNTGRIMIKGSHHIFFDINNRQYFCKNSNEDAAPSSTEIKLYPNPVKIFLPHTNTSNEEYKIYDMSVQTCKWRKP
ncbi:hypothetical protein MUB42_03210 [Apilactobacillus kunkeei]|nr:hypothetical protein MUB42_03210 [Apilactobacillus kunkeei]